MARAYNANHRNLTGPNNPPISVPWSGPVSATFVVHTPDLVVSEIMFHPGAVAPGDTNDVDNFQYIELKNIGSNPLNLTGYKFTNGISFDFTGGAITNLAPGAYVLVVKNIASFNARYGARTNIAGQFSGHLDHDGERITLVGAALELVVDFTYHNSWYPLADGPGFSLVLQDATIRPEVWEDPAVWRASSTEGGSAGGPDPAPPVPPAVFVNEALTHTDPPLLDMIELFNGETTNVNIGGWFLTDDPTVPRKYQIPPATIIPAGGFLLFDESQFNAGGSGFALSSDGDELYLFSASGGLLNSYAHGFKFAAAANGVTFGRYVNSQGADQFVAQTANSLGAANAPPRVGPVVISEIMYHPPDLVSGTNLLDNLEDEYIELSNLTTNDIALFDALQPSNTWRLSKAISFDFPTNASIAATSSALVVSFNPTTNVNQRAAFLARYGLPPTVRLFGPYDGKLDNSADSIRLSRPDTPNASGIVPQILIDQVDYRDKTPWAEVADGFGASLQRLVVRDYGNDPTNWVAATPRPALAYAGGTRPVILSQPSDITVFGGGATNFTVTASGANLRYQWQFNGINLAGATNPTLAILNDQTVQAGAYAVAVFNAAGATLSSNAHLRLFAPVRITVQPEGQTVASNANVTLRVTAVGTGLLRFLWRFKGAVLPGATNDSLFLPNVTLANHGTYTVTVTDDFSSVESDPAELYLSIPPVILVYPESQTLLEGQTLFLSCIATGAPPLTNRWLRNDVVYTIRADDPFLVVSNLPVGTVAFRCQVFNRIAKASTPNTNIVVLADNDHDGMADVWEVAYGFNTNNAADAWGDPDGDGMSNHDEYIAGTDPLNPLSRLWVEVTNGSQMIFTAQSNIAYSVQTRTNLVNGAWQTISNVAGRPGVRTIQLARPAPIATNSPRFFRVATPPVP